MTVFTDDNYQTSTIDQTRLSLGGNFYTVSLLNHQKVLVVKVSIAHTEMVFFANFNEKK